MVAQRQKKALIVGGGPVGALTALSLHKRGWDVEVWEGRDVTLKDPRAADVSPFTLRSINLAISARGLAALRSVDPSLAEDFLEQAIPMKGRMIHHVDGRQESQLYDPKDGQCINSISRPLLNQRLLLALPSEITLKFNQKLTKIDFKKRIAYGKSASDSSKPGEEAGDKPVKGENSDEDDQGTAFDLIIGCDGSWSKVRSEMMRVERMDFKQSFIPHAYIELHMPASDDPSNPYRIDKNHLHIWPRHSFMLIGLPNAGGSFTLTLFAPFKELEALKTRDDALAFFKKHFPSAMELVGENTILDDFANNPRGSLVTINVSPANHSDSGLILGDASHSMVPFYGQGLNCGLEDVRVLNSFLEKHNVSSTASSASTEVDPALKAALEGYSAARGADLEAMCELALDNYTEMRSHVLTPMHHLRRHIDSILTFLIRPSPSKDVSLNNPFPTPHVAGWTSLYSMVTFRPDVGYAEALRKEKSQKKVVAGLGYASAVGAAVGVAAVGFKAFRVYAQRA